MTDKPKAPHCPAAFINALAEEGSRSDLVHYLQETWNDYMQVKGWLAEARLRIATLASPPPDAGNVAATSDAFEWLVSIPAGEVWTEHHWRSALQLRQLVLGTVDDANAAIIPTPAKSDNEQPT